MQLVVLVAQHHLSHRNSHKPPYINAFILLLAFSLLLAMVTFSLLLELVIFAAVLANCLQPCELSLHEVVGAEEGGLLGGLHVLFLLYMVLKGTALRQTLLLPEEEGQGLHAVGVVLTSQQPQHPYLPTLAVVVVVMVVPDVQDKDLRVAVGSHGDPPHLPQRHPPANLVLVVHINELLHEGLYDAVALDHVEHCPVSEHEEPLLGLSLPIDLPNGSRQHHSLPLRQHFDEIWLLGQPQTVPSPCVCITLLHNNSYSIQHHQL